MLYKKIYYKIAAKLKGNKCGLKDQLIAENKKRWLDLGSQRFDDGFDCLSISPLGPQNLQYADCYYQLDILQSTEEDFEKLGKFDLIRMQHVFEHFSFEEGQLLLKNCAKMLNSGGYLLITVPDLRIWVKLYLSGSYNHSYKNFAIRFRLPEDAPDSYFFSLFAHQAGYQVPPIEGEAHKWCYDYEGLEYQVKKLNEFKNIRKLGLLHPLSGFPFTHNRPLTDACLLAEKM